MESLVPIVRAAYFIEMGFAGMAKFIEIKQEYLVFPIRNNICPFPAIIIVLSIRKYLLAASKTSSAVTAFIVLI
jgi:hypothetical protein